MFEDPVSTRWYCYVSVYPRGYWPPPPANSLILRERAGGGWEPLGMVFSGDPRAFVGDGERVGAMTDASVVYADGRYHLVYGWCDPRNARGGLAYAWSDRPEGPFHCADRPLHDDAKQAAILGRYVRAYGSTLLRRRHDWLIVHMMSTPGNSGGTWALFCMTAKSPDGPYGQPTPLLAPQGDRFHPALAEFFPAFVRDGSVYAPATSVALNRTFQTVYRAPLERAHKSESWKIDQLGSVWHAESVPSEAQGIWGQTFSGQVDREGRFRVMFPSKTREDVGAIHMASRPWEAPYRNGVTLCAPRGPAVAVLRRGYRDFAVQVDASASGGWRICWDCLGPLGPNHAYADASLHGGMKANRVEWRLRLVEWTLVLTDSEGRSHVIATGPRSAQVRGVESLAVRRRGGAVSLELAGRVVWDGAVPCGGGRLELLAEEGTILRVDRFAVTGRAGSERETWLATDALAGAGCAPDERAHVEDGRFRYREGFVSRRAGSRAKWNYVGRGFRLFAPRGPEFGVCRVLVDGRQAVILSLAANQASASSVVLEQALPAGRHAVVVTAMNGIIPCDVLEVNPS